MCQKMGYLLYEVENALGDLLVKAYFVEEFSESVVSDSEQAPEMEEAECFERVVICVLHRH